MNDETRRAAIAKLDPEAPAFATADRVLSGRSKPARACDVVFGPPDEMRASPGAREPRDFGLVIGRPWPTLG